MDGEPTWSALPVRPEVPPSPAERAAAIARYEAWARERGARFEALELGVDGAGNSVVRARRPIAADEPIITVPRALVLSDGDLAASATGDPDRWGGTAGGARDRLAVWLALEARCADSPWRPFLDVFPVQVPEMPIFRGGDELAPLAGTSTRLWAAEMHAELVETHARLIEPVRARVSLAAFAWGRAIVSSRSFHAPPTAGPYLAFIPIVDLMDHRWDETAWAYDRQRATYVVHALRDFEVGEPVHFTYGPFGNAHLMVAYGFALPDNVYDEAVLEIGGELFMVTAQANDERWRDVRERLDAAGIAAAARRSLERFDAGTHRAIGGTSAWHTACDLVRRGERRTLEQIAAWAPGSNDPVAP